jgi:hypothetical protein
MNSDLAERLKIEQSAFEFWNLLRYLINEDDIEKLLDDCLDLSRRDVELYLYKRRIINLSENSYNCVNDFLLDYERDPKCSLERLFQQPLNERMLSNFNGDPEQLYLIHSERPRSWFMECLLYM